MRVSLLYNTQLLVIFAHCQFSPFYPKMFPGTDELFILKASFAPFNAFIYTFFLLI